MPTWEYDQAHQIATLRRTVALQSNAIGALKVLVGTLETMVGTQKRTIAHYRRAIDSYQTAMQCRRTNPTPTEPVAVETGADRP